MAKGEKPPTDGVGPPGAGANMRGHGKSAGTSGVAKRGTTDGGSTGNDKGRATAEESGRNGANGRGKTVWKGSEVTRALFQTAEEHRQTKPAFSDEQQYAAEYACARAPSNVMAPGKQRPPTPLERRTLWLWRNGTLHLEQPPLFVTAIHTVRQRARDWDIQQKHKFFRLFLMPHPSFRMRATGTKYHFFMTMLGMNEDNKVTDVTALEFLSTVYTIKCSAESQLIEFLFVRPEERDRWAGKTIKLPGGEVQLQATDAFAEENSDVGFDAAAQSLLFQLRILGGAGQDASDMLAIVEHICPGLAIMDFKPEPATGSRLLDDYSWLATLATHEGPADLAKVRELHVTMGVRVLKLGLHQLRLAVYPPCACCLDDWHPKQRCPLRLPTDEAAAKREEKRVPRILAITLDEPAALPIGEKPKSETDYFKQLESEFARLEPEAVSAQTAEATAAQVAVAATIEASKAEAKREATEKEAELTLGVKKDDKRTEKNTGTTNSGKDLSLEAGKGKHQGKAKPKASGKTGPSSGTAGGMANMTDATRGAAAASKAPPKTGGEATRTLPASSGTTSGTTLGTSGGAGASTASTIPTAPTSASTETSAAEGTSAALKSGGAAEAGPATTAVAESTTMSASATAEGVGTVAAEATAATAGEPSGAATAEAGAAVEAVAAAGSALLAIIAAVATADPARTGAAATNEATATTAVMGEGAGTSTSQSSDDGGSTEKQLTAGENAGATQAADGGTALDVEMTDEAIAAEEDATNGHGPRAPTGERRLSETQPGRRAIYKRAKKRAKKVAAAAKEAAESMFPTGVSGTAAQRPQSIPEGEQLVTGSVGSKRGRAATVVTDPAQHGQSQTHPPTRQARVGTVHTCITATDALTGYFEAAKSRVSKGKTKQLSLSGFCKPISLFDANGDPVLIGGLVDETEDDVVIVQRSEEDITSQALRDALAAGISPEDAITNRMRLAALKDQLNLREIGTPATGSCFAYAVHGARTASYVKDVIDVKQRAATAESVSYREQVALHGLDNIDELLDNGSCSEEEISRLHLGTSTVHAGTRAEIKAFFLADGAQPVDQSIARRHWSSATHLKLLSNYTKEPVYCLDVLHRYKEYREHEVFVQKYVPSMTANEVRVELPTLADTIRQWGVYYSNKVLPIILVLHHFFDADGAITGHYTALRPAQRFYKAWSGNKTRQRSMLERLQTVNALIAGQVNPHALEPQFQSPTPSVGSPDAGSIYVASNEEEETDRHQPVPTVKRPRKPANSREPEAPAGILQEVQFTTASPRRPEEQQEDGGNYVSPASWPSPLSPPEAGAQARAQHAGLGLELSLALDSTASSVFSSDMIRTYSQLSSPGSGALASPIPPEAQAELLLHLTTNMAPDGDETGAKLLVQAGRANRSAFYQWRKTQQTAGAAVAGCIKDCVTLEEACTQLRDSPIFLVHLLRALPHAHVLLATIPDKEIRRLGQELVGIGRMQMLHRFIQGERMKTEAGKTFCQEWMLAIAGAGLGAGNLAEDADRWERLRSMSRFKLQPHRPARMEADDWHRLVAFAVALPEHLPIGFRDVAVPQLCDALMTYLTAPSRSDDVTTVAAGLQAHEWSAIEALFPADYTQYVPPALALTRGQNSSTVPRARTPPESPLGRPNRS